MAETIQLTQIIERIGRGDHAARDELVAVVYEHLRRSANGLMSAEHDGHTLQPTALVNEALVRLIEQGVLDDPKSRRYFFFAATRAMRQILVDHARARNSQKRGAEWCRVPLDEALDAYDEKGVNLLALDEALSDLQSLNPLQFEVIHLRHFGGLRVQEVAKLMGCSVSKVETTYRLARGFLRQRLVELQ